MEADPNPGFDVGRAVEVLHRKALDLGAKPSLGCDPQNAYDVSFQHVALHGFQHEIFEDQQWKPAERCLHSPCRVGGVCFALHEMVQYQLEVTNPRTRAVVAVADVARELESEMRAGLRRFGDVARDLVRTSKAHHEWETKLQAPGQFHDHALTCLTPRDVLDNGVKMLGLLDRLAVGLPRMVESAELAQPPSRKRSAILLTATYQHLNWGGWTYREIAQMVPDSLGGRAEDRVRHRIKSPDARSLVPADVIERERAAETV